MPNAASRPKLSSTAMIISPGICSHGSVRRLGNMLSARAIGVPMLLCSPDCREHLPAHINAPDRVCRCPARASEQRPETVGLVVLLAASE